VKFAEMRLSPRRFMWDFIALLSSRSIAQLLTIGVGLVLVRAMADPVFGAYSLATTSIGLAGVVADFGLDVILAREIAANRERATTLTRDAIIVRLILAGATTLVLAGLALVTPAVGRLDLLLIGGVSLAPRGIMRAVAAALTGLGHVRDAALIEGIGAVGSSVVTVGLMVGGFAVFGDRASAAIWGLLLGSVVGLAAAVRIGQARVMNFGTTPLAVSRLLLSATPFMIVGLAGAAFQSLDIYIVKLYYWRAGSPDAVALYAAPFRVLNALLLVPTAWGVVALPRYVRYIKHPAAVALALRRDLRLGLLIGVALSASCTLLAYPLTVIALGMTYAASAPVLAVVCWMTLPVCLSAPLIAVLTAAGHQSRIAVSVIGAGLLAVAANVVLGATAGGRGVVDNLVIVATVKVASMVVLLVFYWRALSGDTITRYGRGERRLLPARLSGDRAASPHPARTTEAEPSVHAPSSDAPRHTHRQSRRRP
jgi:O-antigen/teichoic acid export membrane protein